jgi:hypothetical protein
MNTNSIATAGLTDSGSGYYQNWYPNGSFRGIPPGYWVSSFNSSGSIGGFWSSNVISSAEARLLIIYQNYVSPGNDNAGRNYGFGVRCVADYNYSYEPLTVTFDGMPATVASSSPTQIIVTTPPHTAGLVNVTVTNALSADTKTNGYKYEEPYISLTIDDGDVQIGGGSLAANTYGTGANVATVKTNYPGYTLTISTNQPYSNTNAKNMKHTSLSQYIDGTSNTCTWNSSFKTLTNTTNTIANNTWGFTLNTTDRDGQRLCQVPDLNSPLIIKSTTVPNETSSGDQTNIYYGTKVSSDKTSGKYQVTITYTAVGN